MKVNTDDLVKQSTAARIRGVSRQAIIRLVQRGKLSKVLIDGEIFVFRKEVEDFKPGTAGRPKRSTKKSRRKKSN